ncbi:MAG: hypothetical protein JNL58_23830 [Planctomyces sp.]|nr:hypothetical protein [Planctomyces sp.]
MDLSSIFSDDQTAIIGCFLALAGCGLIAAISFHFGPAGRQAKQSTTVKSGTRSVSIQVSTTVRPETHEDRKAA